MQSEFTWLKIASESELFTIMSFCRKEEAEFVRKTEVE